MQSSSCPVEDSKSEVSALQCHREIRGFSIAMPHFNGRKTPQHHGCCGCLAWEDVKAMLWQPERLLLGCLLHSMPAATGSDSHEVALQD